MVREEDRAGHGGIAGQKNLTKGESREDACGNHISPFVFFSDLYNWKDPFSRTNVMSFESYLGVYFTSHCHDFVCSSRKTARGNVAKSIVYECAMVSDSPQNGDA